MTIPSVTAAHRSINGACEYKLFSTAYLAGTMVVENEGNIPRFMVRSAKKLSRKPDLEGLYRREPLVTIHTDLEGLYRRKPLFTIHTTIG